MCIRDSVDEEKDFFIENYLTLYVEQFKCTKAENISGEFFIRNDKFKGINDLNCFISVKNDGIFFNSSRNQKNEKLNLLCYNVLNSNNNTLVSEYTITQELFSRLLYEYTNSRYVKDLYTPLLKYYKNSFKFFSCNNSILKMYYDYRIKSALLENMVTEKRYRKKGRGTDLLVEVIKATPKGIDNILLICSDSNVEFYRKSGFRRTNVVIYKSEEED